MGGLSFYEQAQNFLVTKGSPYIQLIPGMSLYKGHKIIKSDKPASPLFRYCLDAFENFINKRYKNKCKPDEYISVRFKTLQDKVSKGAVV